jgi:hypothetical protein
VDTIDERHDRDQPRPARAALDASQPEHDRALVLLADPDRQRDARDDDEHHFDDHSDGDHGADRRRPGDACRRLQGDSCGYRGGRRRGPARPRTS